MLSPLAPGGAWSPSLLEAMPHPQIGPKRRIWTGRASVQLPGFSPLTPRWACLLSLGALQREDPGHPGFSLTQGAVVVSQASLCRQP